MQKLQKSPWKSFIPNFELVNFDNKSFDVSHLDLQQQKLFLGKKFVKRHPATFRIICALKHCWRCLLGVKLFLKKYSNSSSYFLLTFPTWNLLWILPKNLNNKVERLFQENPPTETHIRQKLPPKIIFIIKLCSSSNFQNYLVFCRKNLVSTAKKLFYQILPFDTYSTANLALYQFW